MVATVAGNGLGFFNSSANILGGLGILGQGGLGQSGGRAYVNAVSGNVVLQFADELLSGRGLDLLQLRTYNSLGQLNDGDADGWRQDGERTMQLTGTVNATGSTLKRTLGDGHETLYTFDGSRYVSTEGNGAHDFITYVTDPSDAAKHQWLWTEGSTRLEERYSESDSATLWRLSSQRDTSGNVIEFGYTNNRLASIVDHGSGQKLELVYEPVPANPNLTRLKQLNSYSLNGPNGSLGTAIKEVEYGYDSAGRLTSVTTDLTPTDITDSKVYVTSYSYDGASQRIASITQGDGTSASTSVSFTYYPNTDLNAGRVRTVTDASGTQTFSYSAGTTDITDSLGRMWTYIYDTQQRLIEVRSPPVTGTTRLVTHFHYDAQGNVDAITDARGNAVTYQYDVRGNRTLERDAAGNTVTRSFDPLTNQLLTETRYRTADPDGAGAQTASDPLTTRYVYDEQLRVRFVVSAEGRVSENRYHATSGLLIRTIAYAGNLYDVSALEPTDPLSEATLSAWVDSDSVDRTQVQQTQFSYDLRGNLATRIDYATSNTAGAGVLDAAATVTEYVYSGYGLLLQSIAVRGSERNQRDTLTSFGYDGLNRELTRITAGGQQTTVYDDARNRITLSTASGLVEVRAFDQYGRLLSIRDRDPSRDAANAADAGNPRNPTTRAIKYVYDAAGLVKIVQTVIGQEVIGQDAQGRDLLRDVIGPQQFSFYDALGRLQFSVDATGAVCEYAYNANGQLTTQTCYANAADTSSWTADKATLTLGGAGSDVVLDPLRDRATSYAYDEANRLVTQTDAANVVTTTRYDGASRLTQLQTTERLTQYLYDRDGLQVGLVDPLGYLTENEYDAAGRRIKTIRYSTRSPGMPDVSAPVWTGVTDQTAIGTRPFLYHLPAAFDPDGDTLSYRVVSKPAWVLFDATSLTLSGTPPKGLTGYDVTLEASDQRVPTPLTTRVTVHITVLNSAPSWSVLEDKTVKVNTAGFSLQLPEASDIESPAGELIYSINPAFWPPGLTFNAASRTLSGTPERAGTYIITARVAEGPGTQALFTEKTFVLQVTNDGPSWPAFAPTREQMQAFRTQPFSLTLPAAVDPERQALTYRIASGPSWLRILDPSSPVLSGTPPATAMLQSEPVVVEAVDASGEAVPFSFHVNVENAAPIWPATLESPPATSHGTPFSYPLLVPAVDPEGGTVTYSARGLPSGWHIDATTGTITGTSFAVVGVFTVTLIATDALGSSSESPAITITRTNSAPVYRGGLPDLPIVQGGGCFINLADLHPFVDPDGDTLTTYFLTNRDTVPPDCSAGTLDNVFVFMSGEFTAVGTVIPITIGVIDGFFERGLHTFNITITAASAQAREPAVSAPLVDVLAPWRPTASAADLHSYFFYDGQRLIGAVDERGFLTESVYNEQANTQQSVRYMNAVTVDSTDTLDSLRTRAGDQPNIANDAPRITTTQYDNFGRVSTFTEVDGTTVTRYEYDSAGRVVRQVRGGNTASEQRATRIRYDAFDEVTGTLGGVGDATLTGAATQEQIDAAIATYGTRYEYDSRGRRSKAITRDMEDADLITLYYYDSKDRLTHTVSSIGQVSVTEYDAFGEVSKQVRYAAQVRNTPPDNLLLDELKAGTKGRAELLAEIETFAGAQVNEVTRYDYDLRGQLAKSTDGEGFGTTYEYDDFGQLKSQTRTIKQAPDGTALSTTTTQYGYDLRGQLLAQTADAGGLNFTQRTFYDAFGRVIQQLDAAGKVTTTTYNDSGRAIDITVDFVANGAGLNRQTRTVYDALGRVITHFDAKANETRYTYDDGARSVRITTPEGVSVLTTQTRFGETLSVTTRVGANPSDTAGNTTHYEYDQDGRLLKVTDALGQVVSENLYHSNGLLSETRDANRVRTTFSYDAVNRLFERVVDPEGLVLISTYMFNALDQQFLVTEKQGATEVRVTRYIYDRKGQLTRTTVDPEGLKLSTGFVYDGLGNTLIVTRGSLREEGEGQLQQVTLYEFDKLGRRVKEILEPSEFAGFGSARERDLTTEYRYDSAGQVSRRIDALGQSTWYVNDSTGAPIYTINAEGEVSQNVYDKNGQVMQTRRYATRLSASVLAGFGDVVSRVVPTLSDSDARTYTVYDKDGRAKYSLQAVTAGASGQWTISESVYDAKNNTLIETRRYDKFIGQERISVIEGGALGITLAEMRAELLTLGYDETQPATFATVRRTRFAYDANERLRFTMDATGAVSESAYDPAGHVVKSVRYATRPTLPSGPTEVLTEAMINAAVNRTDLANQVTHFAYDTGGRLRFTAQELARNAAGQATQLIVREQNHDGVSRVVQTTAYASVVTGTFSDADYSETHLASLVTANAAADRRSAMVYDGAGQVLYSMQVSGLNAAGERLHVVSRMEYDLLGRMVRSTRYATAVPLANYTQATLDSAVSAAEVANHAQNRTTRHVYDMVNRLRFTVAADGTFTETVYDALDRVSEVRQFDVLIKSTTPITLEGLSARRAARQVGDGVTRGFKYAYDLVGRQRFAVAADGSLRETLYDAFSQASETRQFSDVTVSAMASITEAGLSALRGTRAVDDGLTRVETCTYDRVGQQRSCTDALGFTEHSTYNALGNRDTFTNKQGNTWDYTYDAVGRLRTQKAPEVIVQLSAPAGERPPAPALLRLETLLEYDALGNLRTRTQASNATIDARTTGYDYDTLGRQTKVIQPGWYDPGTGRVEKEQGAVSLNRFQRTLETRYSAFGDAASTVLRTGLSSFQSEHKTFDTRGLVTYDIDALGNLTGFTYNSFGEQEKVTRYGVNVGAPTNSNGLWSAQELEDLKLTGTQNPLLTTDPAARTITTSYDTRGRKVLVTQPTITDYYASGTQTDFNASHITPGAAAPTTRYEYNVFSQLEHEAVAVDTRTRDTWRYYDVKGRETLTVDALGYQTARIYDVNNLRQVTEYANAGAIPAALGEAPPAPPTLDSKDRITGYEYDKGNRQKSVQRFGLSYASWNAATRSYDLVSTARTVGTTVMSMTYDETGNLLTRTDALGNLTTMQYNACSQLTQITEPARITAAMAATLQTPNMRTTDNAGNVVFVRVTIAIGSHTSGDPFLSRVMATPVTVLTLDAHDNIVREDRNPGDGGATLTTLRSYDDGGNLRSMTDANTAARVLGIQAANDSLGPNVNPLALPAPSIEYAYDYAGRLIAKTQAISTPFGGRLQGTLDQTLEQRYAYDESGRLTDVLDVYTDSAGLRQQSGDYRTYNTFGEVSAQYKEWGAADLAPASLTRAIVARFEYDQAGRLQQQFTSNGETDYFYNLAGDVTRQELKGLASLDTDGRASVGTRITETAYDILGRAEMQRLPDFDARVSNGALVSFGRMPFARQTYDRWGNIQSRRQGGLVLNPAINAPNIVTEGDTSTYDYDADNHLATQHDPTVAAFRADTSSYQVNLTHQTHYDLLGRVVMQQDFADDAGTAQIEAIQLRALPRLKQYDAAGRLTAETDATGHTTSYGYDGNGKQVAVRNAINVVLVDAFDNNGNEVSHSLWLGNAPITLNLSRYDGANRRFAEIAAADNHMDWTYTQYDERNLIAARSDGTTNGLTLYRHDELGNKIGTTDPLSKTQSWTYSHNTSDFTVGRLNDWRAGNDGASARYEYDGFGQLDSEVYGGSPSQIRVTRSYDYFENGLLHTLTDHKVRSNVINETVSTEYRYTSKGQLASEHFTVIDRNPVTGENPILQLQRLTVTTYDALGRIHTVEAPSLPHTRNVLNLQTYNYDELGNRRQILASYTPMGEAAAISDKWYLYDDEGRVTMVKGVKLGNQIVADDDSTLITYDALGRRETAQKFAGLIEHEAPLIPNNPGGDVIKRVTVWKQYTTEHYSYDALNYLTQVDVIWIAQREKSTFRRTYNNQGALIGEESHTPLPDEEGTTFLTTATYGYDLGGEMRNSTSSRIAYSTPNPNSIPHIADASAVLETQTTSVYSRGGLNTQHISHAADHSKDSTATYHYDGLGNITDYTYVVGPQNGSQHTTTYEYTYQNLFGGEKLSDIRQHSAGVLFSGHTQISFGARGEIEQQIVSEPGPTNDVGRREDFFRYDSSGRIILQLRRSTDGNGDDFDSGTRDYFYVGAQQVALIGTGTLKGAQFNDNYTPISAAYPASSPSTYTVNSNDTLASIAQTVFGDAQLWYLIADENSLGFGPSDRLPSTEIGRTYRIPRVVTTSNRADSFTPYNPASILGIHAPGTWTPGQAQCDVVGAVVVTVAIVAIAAVVAYATGGLATGAAASVVESQAAAAMIGAAVGAAAGNVVSQGLKVELGLQKEGFNGWEVLATAAAAAATAGFVSKVAGLDPGNVNPDKLAFASSMASSTFGQIFNDMAGVSGSGGSQTTQIIIDGALGMSGASASLNSTNFKWSQAISTVAASALDPGSGWIIHSSSRNWANIAVEAIGAFGKVVIGGVVAHEKRRTSSAGRMQIITTELRGDQGKGPPAKPGHLSYEYDVELTDGSIAADDSGSGWYLDEQGNVVDANGMRVRTETIEIHDTKMVSGTAVPPARVAQDPQKTGMHGQTFVIDDAVPSELPTSWNYRIIDSPTHAGEGVKPRPGVIHAGEINNGDRIGWETSWDEPTPAERPSAPASSFGAGRSFKSNNVTVPAAPKELSFVGSGNAYMFDGLTHSLQMGELVDKLAKAGFKEVHVSIGAHGEPFGSVAPDPNVLLNDLVVIKYGQARYRNSMRIHYYDLGRPSEAAQFYAIQARTALGTLPDTASLHSPCYSANCVPKGSPAQLWPEQDLSRGQIWREADDVWPEEQRRPNALEEPVVKSLARPGQVVVAPGGGPKAPSKVTLNGVAAGVDTFTGIFGFLATAYGYGRQMAAGDYKGAEETATWTTLGLGLARIDPALAIPLIVPGARSEFVNNPVIMQRATEVGNLVDRGFHLAARSAGALTPTSPFIPPSDVVRTPMGGFAAGIYASILSADRAAGGWLGYVLTR